MLRILSLYALLVVSTSAKMSCSECSSVVGAIAKFASNSTSIAQVIEFLDGECSKLHLGNETTKLCEDLVQDIVGIFPWAYKELNSLAWNVEAVCATFIHSCTIDCCLTNTSPEQIHLSLVGSDPSEMGVTWMTLDETPTTVQWGVGGLTSSATGNTHTYTKGDWNGIIHTAVMSGLQPNTTYTYRVGDANAGWSSVFTFKTFTSDIGSGTPLRVIVIGDMGYDDSSDNTVNAMTELVQTGQVDMVIHNGDISYADGYMRHWDMFLRKVQPIAAQVPYMVSPGNHEFWFNFTAYKARFFMPSMPGSGDNMYYSWNIGTVHFVGLDTETAVDTGNLDKTQVDFIDLDLKQTNKDRTNTPWIVAYGHRPFYCTNHDKHEIDCKVYTEILRAKAETSFYLNKVNLVISAHMHGYERMWPVFKGKVMAQNYNNPPAPVYMVNGAAGNREGNENAPGDQPWSAFHTGDLGYVLMEIQGNSLSWDFFSVQTGNSTLLDHIDITI